MNQDSAAGVQPSGDEFQEALWLEAARLGRDDAWAEIHRCYYKNLWSAVNRMLQDEALTEDVVQEAFLKAYRRISHFRGQSRFGTWLYSIALNQARDTLRSLKRRQKYLGLFPVQQDEDDVPREAIDPNHAGRAAELADQGRLIRQALSTLDAEHRAVVELRLVQGFSTDETARILKCKRGTVLSRLFYSCQKLKILLQDSHEQA